VKLTRVGRLAIGWAPVVLPLLFAIVACVNNLDLSSDEQDATVALQDYNFADQQVHTASTAHTFTISPASGVQSDTVTAITESCPDFSVAAVGLPAVVKNVCTGGGSACTGYAATTYSFTATFTPQVTGTTSCPVSVTISGTTTSFTLTGKGIEPAVRESVSPASALDLGQVRVGDTSAAASVLVRNFGSGPQPMTVSSVAFDAAGTSAGFAIASGTTGSHVVAANGGSDPYTITCTPGSAAPLTGTLTISTDDPATPSTHIAVTCTGIESDLAFLPSSPALLAGKQAQKATRVGEPVTVPITLENDGTASMTVHSLALDGDQLSFVGTPPAEFTIASGKGVDVVLQFSAATAVDQGTLGTLTVTYDDAQVRTINVLGAALATSMSISPDGNVDLGPVCIGKTASQPFFILKNNPGTFVVSAISQPAAPFSIAGMLPAPDPIAVDTNAVDFMATVTPTAAGALHSSFSVTTDIPASTPHAIDLVATALPAGVTPTPTMVDLGTISVGATSVGQMVTLTNCGDAPLTLSQTEIVGANAGDFAIASAPTTTAIPAGGAAQFVITLTPAAAGSLTATLQLTYDTGVAMVPLAGTGTGEVPDTRTPEASTYYGCSIGSGGGGGVGLILVGLALTGVRRRRNRVKVSR
jgi:hypothetical protein